MKALIMKKKFEFKRRLEIPYNDNFYVEYRQTPRRTLAARIDEETNKRLVDYCKRNSTNKTEVVRKGIDLVLGETEKE